jgi:hypothetical protein
MRHRRATKMMPPNKRMQLTKLRAAPERRAEVPPCAPAGGTDGGTASQLIASVRRTTGGSMRRATQSASMLIGVAALSLPLLAAPRWRKPTAAEIGQTWRNQSPHHYAEVSADFDGDGRPDQARLMVATSGRQAALVVELGDSPAHEIVLDLLDDVAWLDTMGIDVVAPGKYPTACGKGYWKCERAEPAELTLHRPAIDYFRFESANSYFVYDSEAQRFQRIWMSD